MAPPPPKKSVLPIATPKSKSTIALARSHLSPRPFSLPHAIFSPATPLFNLRYENALTNQPKRHGPMHRPECLDRSIWDVMVVNGDILFTKPARKRPGYFIIDLLGFTQNPPLRGGVLVKASTLPMEQRCSHLRESGECWEHCYVQFYSDAECAADLGLERASVSKGKMCGNKDCTGHALAAEPRCCGPLRLIYAPLIPGIARFLRYNGWGMEEYRRWVGTKVGGYAKKGIARAIKEN